MRRYEKRRGSQTHQKCHLCIKEGEILSYKKIGYNSPRYNPRKSTGKARLGSHG